MDPDRRPMTLWTVRMPDGQVAHAALLPEGDLVILAWFIGDVVQGVEDFTDWNAAVRRGLTLRSALLSRRAS